MSSEQSQDEYRECPFNPNHKNILVFRMPQHILKCQKQYKGEKLEQCPYNATHFVKSSEYKEHFEKCIDYQHAFEGNFVTDNK